MNKQLLTIQYLTCSSTKTLSAYNRFIKYKSVNYIDNLIDPIFYDLKFTILFKVCPAD